MNIINNIKESYRHIPYTWNHKMAIIKLEKRLRGHNTFRILLHDTDKIIVYLLFPWLTLKQNKNLHRRLNQHHHFADIKNLSIDAIEEIVLDWESARYSKKDKPMSAKEYALAKHPECYPYLIPTLIKWKINW